MPALIVVDQNTFEVQVRHDLQTPVFPTEQTVEIQKVATQLKAQLNDFLETKHNPLVKQLLQLVESYNVSMDPALAAQRKAAELAKIDEKPVSVTVNSNPRPIEPQKGISKRKKKR